jgi:hypothetical protein
VVALPIMHADDSSVRDSENGFGEAREILWWRKRRVNPAMHEIGLTVR